MTAFEYVALAIFATILGSLMVWSVYEMLTMPPDDERWDIVAESEWHETHDHWFRK